MLKEKSFFPVTRIFSWTQKRKKELSNIFNKWVKSGLFVIIAGALMLGYSFNKCSTFSNIRILLWIY